MEQRSLRERAREFWSWFVENEAQIEEYVCNQPKYSGKEIMEYLSKGIQPSLGDIHFEVGNYEFSFAMDGDYYLCYLTSYVVEMMPEALKEKWSFHPYKPRCSNCQLSIYDKMVGGDQVQVHVDYSPDRNYFNLAFYNKALLELPENQCYSAFYLLLEMNVGENISSIYIDEVERLEEKPEDSIPLSSLYEFMQETLKSVEKEFTTDPTARYSVYQMEPGDKQELRFDIFVGTTCFFSLLNDYYSGETQCIDDMEAMGLSPRFLAWSFSDDQDRMEAKNLRDEITDRIEAEVLGVRGSGEEIGIVIGQAMGTGCAYVDLLLYDCDEFLRRARKVLDEYEYLFFLSEFRQDCELVHLFELEGEE